MEHETGDPFDPMIAHSRYHDLVVFGLRGLFDYGIVAEPRTASNCHGQQYTSSQTAPPLRRYLTPRFAPCRPTALFKPINLN